MSEMFFGAGTVRPGVQPEIRCPERTDGVVHITAYPVFPGIELRYNDVHARISPPPTACLPLTTAERDAWSASTRADITFSRRETSP